MKATNARLLALDTIVRIVLAGLSTRPALRRALLLAALDAAHELGDLETMQEVCKLLDA